LPKLEPGYIENFQTLKTAAANGDLALLDCQDRKTGRAVRVMAAIGRDGNEFTMVPLAKMFDGDPYEELNPPSPDGGYFKEEE